MKSRTALPLLGALLLLSRLASAEPATPAQKTFPSAQAAAEALVSAAETFDVLALKAILGPEGVELVVTEDPVLDRIQAREFAATAREKLVVATDPKNAKKATLITGRGEWPMPIPIIEAGSVWRFDTVAGRREILFRRIGRNELAAIQVCRGFVEAQDEYASQKHDGARVNEYAQKVISTPGKQDGLAWQNPDGTWGGPVGETIAHAIAEGYRDKYEPYHGYYFKVLKGQGASAPLGELDFVVQGVMTFLVSHDGVVWQKDLGPKTFEAFRAMERFDPDKSWSPVRED